MKKTYQKPETEVVEMEADMQLMAGSPVGSPVFATEDSDDDEYGL